MRAGFALFAESTPGRRSGDVPLAVRRAITAASRIAHKPYRCGGGHITIYANPGHVFMVVTGRRFDTTGRDERGSRWQWRSRSANGHSVRHPPGL